MTTFNELLGKVILVGVTYYDGDNEVKERKQFYGEVISADESEIKVKCSDGTERVLPPDLNAVKKAPEGEYTLHETGEIVTNPDFLSMWIVNSAEALGD